MYIARKWLPTIESHTPAGIVYLCLGTTTVIAERLGDSTVESGTSHAVEIRAFPTISFSNRGHVGVPIITQRISPSTSTFVHPSYTSTCVCMWPASSARTSVDVQLLNNS